MPKIKIMRPIAEQITRYFADQPMERGGMIGSSRYLNRIDHFSPVPGIGDRDRFTPDMDAVNAQIADWRSRGICFCGFFHSHPDGPTALSGADRTAIESWVRAAGLPFLCFGLTDGKGALSLYLAENSDTGRGVIRPMRRSAVSGFSRYFVWRVEHE